MVALGEKLVLTKSVGALLFDGFNDTLLHMAKKLNATTIPYSKFGWFYAVGVTNCILDALNNKVSLMYVVSNAKFFYFLQRNGSETYDGTFNMLTGSSNINNLGLIKKWNYSSRPNYYNGSCGLINGSLGDLWPPLLDNSTVSIFINDICT